MQEILWVIALEDADGQVQLPAHVMVNLLHHQQRYVLVRYAPYQRVLQHMRERAVADVVHQNGGEHRLGLRVENELPFLLQRHDGLARQVERPQRVLKPCVPCPGIDHRGQPQLVDTVQPLHQRMLHDAVQQPPRNLDESEDRVIDYLVLYHLLS